MCYLWNRPHSLGYARPSYRGERASARSCDGRIGLCTTALSRTLQSCARSLVARGHVFKSETDTEVLAHLLEEAYYGRGRQAGSHDLVSALRQACEYLVGAYGVAAVCEDEPA